MKQTLILTLGILALILLSVQAANHPLDTPSSNPVSNQHENSINQLLHAVKSDDNTTTCHENPKSLFTPGQFAELSLKYTPSCDYWLSLDDSALPSDSSTTDKGNGQDHTDRKDELFRSLFVNTVTYTICEDDSDSDSANNATDHNKPATTTSDTAHHDHQLPTDTAHLDSQLPSDTTHHDNQHPSVKPGEVAVAPPVSAPESNQTVQPISTPPSTDHHDKDHRKDHDTDHGNDEDHSLMIQFSFTSNDLDLDLPRFDREMNNLVSDLSRKHGQPMKLHRKVEFSPEDVKCQREYFNKLMDDICIRDSHRTAQEKLNLIYNEQLQTRIKVLTERQKQFESEVISRDNERIEQRIAAPSNHTTSHSSRARRFLRHHGSS